LVASVDKAKEMGINWWEQDSYLSSKAKEAEIESENKAFKNMQHRLPTLPIYWRGYWTKGLLLREISRYGLQTLNF